MSNATNSLEVLWKLAEGDSQALAQVQLAGDEPVLPSSYLVGTAAQVSIAAAGLAAAEVHYCRGGERQSVSVDMHHAATEFRSESLLRIDDQPSPPLWDKIAGAYQCGDGRWVRIHTNFTHHRDGILAILGCENDRDAVARALTGWTAERFEDRAAEAGTIAAMMRGEDEWDAHPQGQAVGALPVFTFERIGDAPVQPMALSDRPLNGVRVLDLTRIIAGPVAGRTLAAHGADVLLVTSAHLPSVLPLVVDTGRGKRACHIDLRADTGKAVMRELLADADVFIQGYRPGAIARFGFSPEDAAATRPGIIYASLSAYGHDGPWQDRRGFDSIVQTASGFNAEEARVAQTEGPKPLPCQALDHASGYLMAFGAMMALQRRMREGGSWHVRVSLARTGRWIRDQGRVTNGMAIPLPSPASLDGLLEEVDSGFGRLTVVRHAARLAATPAVWSRPSMPLGSHPPTWAT